MRKSHVRLGMREEEHSSGILGEEEEEKESEGQKLANN
jgi:hypothetical protein